MHGETRKLFQEALFLDLKLKAGESNIQINQALVRHFEVPQELRDPITRKVIAEKVKLQYVQEQEREKENAKLAREKELVNFESKKVMAETQKVKAIIQAQEQRDVEEIKKRKRFSLLKVMLSRKRLVLMQLCILQRKKLLVSLPRKKPRLMVRKYSSLHGVNPVLRTL